MRWPSAAHALNAVFDLSPDGFVVFDREGQMVYCNQAFVQMTGWDAGSACDLSGFDRRFGALCTTAQAYAPVAAAAGEAGTHADTLELVRPERRVLAAGAPEPGRPRRIDPLLPRRDARDRGRPHEERVPDHGRARAAHADGQHLGFAELMLARPVPPERQRDVLETIHRQAALLINMVNELLDLARIEARRGKDFRITEHGLGPLIEETVAH